MAERPLELAILATTRAYVGADGRVGLSRKFLEGVLEYQRHWPGHLAVLMERTAAPPGELDTTWLRPPDAPFELHIAPLTDVAPRLHGASVVLAMLARRYLPLQATVPDGWVWFAEWSLNTRLQIAALSTSNPVNRLRRVLGARVGERRLRQAAALAQGIQCNGVPAFDQYRGVNPNSLLYFDSRLTHAMLATTDDINRRLSKRLSSKLRLVYSGRLVTIKGADRLIDVALELRRVGVAFELSVFGEGDLQPLMAQRIRAHRLEDLVKLEGVLEFERQLIPRVKGSADLFVCCHRQGDPSSTYLETFGCGVPMVGYANEALASLVERSGAGWVVPVDQPKLLAARIAGITPEQLRAGSQKALEFAGQHTFEQTFRRRAEHLLATASSLPRTRPPARR